MLRFLARAAFALVVASVSGAQATSPKPATAGTHAADVDPLHQSGQNVTISLLTMGNGLHVWELFGHDGLWIHDNVTGRDTVFNWGVFSFHQANFILNYLRGKRIYAMGGDSLTWIKTVYRYLNRDVWSQELDLTPAERDSVLAQIRWYAQPENVNYRYDDFRDNCSTRVRDILDAALHGQMRAQANGLTGTTYRWHSLRLMQTNKLLAVGVDIGLGRPSDRELTKWEVMYLPRKLHDFVGALQVRDSAGRSHPLVRSERTLFQSTRPPEFEAPPRLWPALLGIGLAVAALLAWLGASAESGGKGMRRTAAIVIGVWTFIMGILGLVLTLLWTVTDHFAAHRNENLFLFNPIWLVLAFPLVASLWSGRLRSWTRPLAMTVAALAAVALLVHLVGLSAQDNLAIIGLGLPPALAIGWIAHRRTA